MREAQNDVILVSSNAPVAIEAADAIKAASAGLGFIVDKAPAEMSLAKVTVTDYGKELEPDPSKPSRVDPTINDQLAWVIVYNDVDVPLFGPNHPDEDKSAAPQTYTARFFVLIDANTGEFLSGESL